MNPSTPPTPFFDAVKQGDVERVRRLVAADPALVDARDGSGLSAVLTAVYHRRRDVLNVLVARGASLTLAEAAASGEVDRVERLLDEGADLGEPAADGWTPLHLAAHFGHGPVVEQLIARGADVAVRSANANRNTPLHAALAGRQSFTAGLLVGHGADVNAADADGWRPLHLAVANGNVDAIRMLVEQGADLAATNAAGLTPLAFARQQNQREVVAYFERF